MVLPLQHVRVAPTRQRLDVTSAGLGAVLFLGGALRIWGLLGLPATGAEYHYLRDVAVIAQAPSPYVAAREHFHDRRHTVGQGGGVGHPVVGNLLMGAGAGAAVLALTADRVVRSGDVGVGRFRSELRAVIAASQDRGSSSEDIPGFQPRSPELQAVIAGGRLVNGLAGLLTGALVFSIARSAYGPGAGLFAAAVAAFLPLAIRYDRSLYLDPIFALFWALLLWVLMRPGDRLWSARVGAALALVIATKTSGLLAIPVALAGMFLTGQSIGLRGWRLARTMVPSLIIAAFLATALTDPIGYVDAVLNPADPDYQNRSPIWYLWYALQDAPLRFLGGSLLVLVTPPIVALAGWGVVTVVRTVRTASALDRLLLVTAIITAPIALLHLPGLSGDHGLTVYVSTLSLLAGRGLVSLPRVWRTQVAVAALVLMLPFSIVYGWRLAPAPYPSDFNLPDFGEEHYQFDRTPLQTGPFAPPVSGATQEQSPGP
ncbi:MAG: glycosyltransferase family 39 protein [Chloroflexi bacterium]|nr:glycosyltransferase family 39 protein [Chloroflexota bacterium]